MIAPRCTFHRHTLVLAMMRLPFILLLMALPAAFAACSGTRTPGRAGTEVFRSDQLIIRQLTANTFVHTSFHPTDDYGLVPCNGLIARAGKEVIIFDTPANDSSAQALIAWVEQQARCTIKAVVPTHFHVDCLGGLRAFHAHGIPSHAHDSTLVLARRNGYEVPEHGFSDSLVLALGGTTVLVKYPGKGHTVDNVVGYFAQDQVLFGGCLLKELNATKGYLGDADVAAWPRTVERIKRAFPDVRTVVPGHGEPGGPALLDYTIQLFSGQ